MPDQCLCDSLPVGIPAPLKIRIVQVLPGITGKILDIPRRPFFRGQEVKPRDSLQELGKESCFSHAPPPIEDQELRDRGAVATGEELQLILPVHKELLIHKYTTLQSTNYKAIGGCPETTRCISRGTVAGPGCTRQREPDMWRAQTRGRASGFISRYLMREDLLTRRDHVTTPIRTEKPHPLPEVSPLLGLQGGAEVADRVRNLLLTVADETVE